jgi:inner membrane protein
MATVLGHAILGATSGWALPRRQLPLAALWLGALCSAAPDLDAVGFWVGIPYQSWLGHRGFSHSLVFAMLLAAAVTAFSLVSSAYKGSRWALFGFLAACTASHGLLDGMTDGGLGVAFFSPFSNQRYFLPLQPIVVSPLNPARLLSRWGLQVLLSETLFIGVPAGLIVLVRMVSKRRRSQPTQTPS